MNKLIKKFKDFNALEKFISIFVFIFFISILIKLLYPYWMYFLLILVLLVPLYFLFSNNGHTSRLLKEYEAAKDALRLNPGDLDLREKTFEAGRLYYDRISSASAEKLVRRDLDPIILPYEYNLAKDFLRKYPKEVKYREGALKAGREYYAYLRDDKKLTIYDEQAISNDLNAITG